MEARAQLGQVAARAEHLEPLHPAARFRRIVVDEPERPETELRIAAQLADEPDARLARADDQDRASGAAALADDAPLAQDTGGRRDAEEEQRGERPVDREDGAREARHERERRDAGREARERHGAADAHQIRDADVAPPPVAEEAEVPEGDRLRGERDRHGLPEADPVRRMRRSSVIRAASCGDGSRCAESASRHGSR